MSIDATHGAGLGKFRTWTGAALLVAASAAMCAAQQPARGERLLVITALSEGAQAMLGAEAPEPGVRLTQKISGDEPLAFSVTAAAGGRGRATLRIREVNVVAVVDSATLEFLARSDALAQINLFTEASPGGVVDVYHSQPEPAALVLATPGGTLLLYRGALRARRVDGGTEIAVVQGRATVFPGKKPSPDVKSLGTGVELAAGMNAMVLRDDGAAGSPQRVENVLGEMNQRSSGTVQNALLPDFIRVAEAVAEGDIEPPTRGAGIVAATVAPEVRIPELVPRGNTAIQTPSASQAIAAQSAQSLAEAFIGTGNAALATVGARLERTRITGASGSSTSPLAASGQLRSRFTLGR